MPRRVRIPGIISTLYTTHIHPEFGLKAPIEFDLGTQSLEYPYVWNPGATLSFTYTLDEVPEELFIDEVYRYGDNTEPSSAPFSSLSAGRGSIPLTGKNLAMITNNSQYRLFNEDPTDELSEGTSISREYGEKIQPGEVLYGHSNTVTSHILHQDAVGKKIVLIGYTLDGKNVTVTYKSEETSPFTLRPFMTLEPFPIINTGPLFNRHDHLAVSVSGNKIYMCGVRFGNYGSSARQLNIYDKDTYECETLDVQSAVIDPLLSDSSDEPYVRGFSVDGDYLALVCEGSEPNYDVLLYKISTNEWSNRNNSIVAANHYISESSTTLGKKPLDIKYLESTDKVCGMFTCFEGNFKPKIIYSNDNLETWTTIFDESKLTSSVNTNIYGPIQNTIPAAQCISKSTLSKIIDEDTMFSEFCSYTTNNLFINPAPMVYGYNAQFLLKTTDRGTTWTDVMKDHPEYAFSGTVRNHISDDGQKIYSMIFFTEKSGITGLTIPTFPYVNGSVLFNSSSDGGSTWTYPTGGWSVIGSGAASDYPAITSAINTPRTVEEQHLTHKTMLYPHTDDDIVAVFRNTDGVMVHYISSDGGATWITGYGEIYGNKVSDSVLQGDLVGESIAQYEGAGAISMEPFDANDTFGAYVGYHGTEYDVDNTDKYSVSDFIFASMGGGYGGYGSNYSEDKIMDSYIYIPTTNTTSKISKLKGYYI